MNKLNSKNHLFIKNEKCTEKLVIFFSGTDKDNGKFDFYNIAKNCNHSFLLLNNGKNEWYQNGIPSLGKNLDETIKFIKELISIYAFKKVYCVGMSMGGYGACLYGTFLNAAVLAFGFDSLLHTPGSRSFKRLKKVHSPDLADLYPLIQKSNIDLTSIAGECDALDLYSCNRLSKLPNVKSISISGVGHGVPPFIKKNYNLQDFIDNWLSDVGITKISESTDNYSANDLVCYIYNMHLKFIKKDWEGIINSISESNYRILYHEYVNYMIGVSYLETNHVDLSIQYLTKSVAIAPHFPGARYRLARALMKKGLLNYALIHLEKHTLISEKPAYSHLFLSDIYMHKNDLDSANKHLLIAENLGVPEEKIHQRRKKISLN
ncbi:accessory Sec system protein Asp2 [Pantoea sp. EA-12]|uniref:tetratricopeptide repeat protein n=1 Tax=Pantoea sp. EA-12 TaxID=3043303 RepID=UPI0024B54255|nr:accessory Sec system protein Asp2 [Pantoea sp. EA-12]MDI9221130.1 accessory Sec system protein Asp2 [Pantoea sp. EA-12]